MRKFPNYVISCDYGFSFYTCKFKSRKWQMIAFSYIVDIALVSSSTLFALNGNKGPLKQIHLNLVWILYEVLLVHLFNKEINHFELLPSSGKLLWYLIWCSFRIPLYFPSKSEKMSSCYICLEQLPANCNQKSVSGTKLLCQACKKKHVPKTFS